LTKEPIRIFVSTLEELEKKSHISFNVPGHDLVIFYHEGQVYALDNRCPHMGFPLSRGTTKHGILTCDWHHARFDLKSGGTFDLWADDVPAFPVQIQDGKVWVIIEQNKDVTIHHMQRLQDGLEQNNGLLIAKSVIALLSSGMEPPELFRRGIKHGVSYRQDGWGQGLTILTCMVNLLPFLSSEDRQRALYDGLSAVAQDCDGAAPRFTVRPLPKMGSDVKTLKQWFRHFIEVRDSDGAERCLVSAIRENAEPLQIADMMFAAATDHRYLDSGHVLDFTNKAFEALDVVGWDLAESVLTSLVPLYAKATRMEERSSWRHPIDLKLVLERSFKEIPVSLELGAQKTRELEA
jgi:nitrite reductase/ring-hydroxylating ferredoxin subunit